MPTEPARITGVDPKSVFLNVPFDTEYGPLFIALISGLMTLGRKPRCVLEVPSDGHDRLRRLHGLISQCGASVHDLSRCGLSGTLQMPRFNMPFELGLACGIALHQEHRFFLFEEQPYRIQASLSDLNGYDPHIHGGKVDGILRCLLDCFGRTEGTPSAAQVREHSKRLTALTAELQLEKGVDSPFYPAIFYQITRAGAQLARLSGLIA